MTQASPGPSPQYNIQNASHTNTLHSALLPSVA